MREMIIFIEVMHVHYVCDILVVFRWQAIIK